MQDEDSMTGVAPGRTPPLWRRIAQALSAEIGPGGLQPGARLPTEAQLTARFGVNRHTVRRAIESMTRAGLVRVEQGRGSFVADDVIPYPVQTRTRFNEWIRRQNREPTGQVLHIRDMACSPVVAAGLQVERGSPVALLERLGFADGVHPGGAADGADRHRGAAGGGRARLRAALHPRLGADAHFGGG
jgi:GntR family phosphonate transport system transcriptional regulator